MTKNATKVQEQQGAVQDAQAPAEVRAGLYSITFAPKGSGRGFRNGAPEELNVGLPNGGVLFMNANLLTVSSPTKDDPKATRPAVPGDLGFAYAEAILTPTEAAEWAEHYALHGLLLKPIAKSALKRHPIHNEDEA